MVPNHLDFNPKVPITSYVPEGKLVGLGFPLLECFLGLKKKEKITATSPKYVKDSMVESI